MMILMGSHSSSLACSTLMFLIIPENPTVTWYSDADGDGLGIQIVQQRASFYE